jgi:hypothetical protein
MGGAVWGVVGEEQTEWDAAAAGGGAVGRAADGSGDDTDDTDVGDVDAL